MKSTYLLMGNKLTTSPGIKKANIVFRLCLAFVLSIFSVTNASAVITVTTDDGSKGACVGSMVEVIASGTNDHWVQFQYRVYGEGSWKDLNGVTSSSSTLFPKMPNNKVYFRVIDTEDPANSSDPDGVEVGVRTEGCPAACVVSDAGAYIHGTDFDLIDKSSHEAEKPAIPADIESYFMDGDAKVQFSKNEVNNYKVTTEIESYFGPGLKPKNNANSNFYYTYDDNTNKGKPFTYVFPYGTWHDQPYTFKMVFYLYFDSSCGMDDNAAIKLETGQGNFGSQKADVNVYIDSSDELVSSSLTSAQSFGHAKVFEPGNLQNGAKEHGKDYLKNKLLRVEATFYGVFPHTNQKLGPNLDGTTWNNDDDFGMYPLFEQFGSCCKMAIDFISAELPSVCLSDQSKCKSDTTIKVNAAGFPEDVVKGGKFKWYYRLANGTWSELTNLEGKSEVDIKIDFLGKRHFKVVGLSSNEYIAVDKREITIEFDLGGLDCEPAGPDKITTDSRTCLPKTGALEIPFKVTPELSDPDVRYGWSLTAPDGKTVYVNRDKTTNAVIMDLLPAGALVQPDKLFNSDFSNWRSGRIVIPAAFVASMPAGDSLKYTLTVQQYKKGKTDTWKSVNDPKSSVLTFYPTPDASFALSQGNVEGDPTKICPYVSPVEFTANTTNKGGYTYLWSIAAGGSFEKTNEKTADIKLPIDCDVKTLSGVNLTVSVTAMPTCKDSKSKDVEISRELPEVKCPVGADIVKDLDKIECPDKTVPVLLHMPQIINTCDPDPLVTIDFEGSYVDDKVVKPYSHPQIKAKLSKLTEALLTIDAPVTKSSVSNGYIRAIYNAYDACNNKSAKPCTLLITVVDTKGPNISCEEKAGGKRILGDIVVKMSEVGNDVCDGVNVTIPTPVLTDLCDNSKITGEFWMTSEPKTPTLSDKFLIGKTTTITWRFYDHAGNYSECHQDVVVVDDRKPKLNCPATDETLEISTDVKTCNTSAASALKQILDLLGNVEPSATNYCGTTDKIDKTVKWSADGLTWKDTAKAVFAKDETYSVRWEFSRHYIDANGDPQVAVDYCVQKFIIKDKVKPEVDCSMVDNIIANVNIKTRQRVYSSNGQIHNYTYKEDYASAVLPDGESDGVGDKVCKDDPEVTYYTDDCSKVKGPAKPGDKDNLVDVIHNVTNVVKGPGPGGAYTYKSTPGYEFKFSLAEQLVEANIPTATDRCDGVLLPKIVISDKNGVENVVPGTTVAEMVEAMRKFKFMVENSPYTVKYVFTDSEGNSDLCEHTITAVRQGAPITNCWEDSAHLAANDVCEATTEDYSYAKVPSATIKYNLVTISAGSKEKVEEISKTIYPYKIVRDYFVFTDKKTGEYDESTPTTHLEALNDSPLKSHKTTQYIAPAVGTDKSIKIYESKATPEAWKDVLATTFPLGVTKISLYYQNMSDNSNKEVYEESVCTAYIVVADETDPVVDCKAFAGTITKQISKDDLAKNNCFFTWEQVGLTKPEVSQLDIKDNCSGNSTDNAENFTIEGYRYYHGLDGTEAGDEYKESDAEFKGNFQIGTTEVIWRIFDESGNSDPNVCRQNVVVVDDEAPECPTLKDITVAVQNDVVGCYANAVDVQKHPNFNANVTAEDDHCSPTGADIPYFKVERSDDKTLTDKYPAGTTVITWWFKDNALVQNEIGCPQNVVVTDSAGPKFDCKSEDRTYEIETGCTFSSDKVEWYVPSPTDNCDGDDPKNMVFTLILQQMKSKTEVKPGTSAEKYVYNTNTLQYSPVIPDLVAGIHKASWVITDSKGNESDSCTFYVHVKDTIPPRPVCPEGVNVNAPVDECEAVFSLDPEDYKIIDPCDGVEIVPTWKRSDDATSLDAPFHVGDTYVTWTWTDTTGNSHSCEQLIHVKDVTPPVATCTHVGDTIEVPTYTCEATSADLRDNGLKSPTATDECQSLTPDRTTEVYYKGVSGLESPVKQVDTNGNPIPWTDLTYRIGYYTIDFIFTDTTGNSSKCSVDVFIKDISAPEVECPNSRVVESPALNECKFDFDASLTNPSIGVEHCLRTSISPVAHIFDKTANDYKEEILEFPVSISAGDSIDIRWDYISKYGYSTSCYQRLVVVDNQWPDNFCETLGLTQIDLVADPEKCEHTVAPGDIPVPSFEDNCGTINGELVSYIYVSGSKPDTTIVDNVIPTSFRTGKTILRWRFHDTAHEDSCEQMVFVKGSIAPDIDCDTFRTFFDTVPECDTRSVAVRTPYAIDVCAPEGVSDSVAGVPSRSDGLAIDAPFPLGNTVVTWTFTDFTGNVSSSCKDTVNVRTEKEMEITCVDEINPDMKEGDCDYQVTVPVATAKHPCLNVTFPGTPYLKGSTKPLPVVDGKLDYKFHVGKYKLLWVFVDSVTNSLVKSIDTCVTDVQIGNKNQMPVDCDNYPAIKKSLAGNCTIDAADLGFNDPEVVDLCTGQTIVPYIYRTLRDKPSDTLKVEQLGAFKVGEQDTIVRVFYFKSDGQEEGSSLECRQPVWILDSANIKTNCLPEDSVTTLIAEDGKCDINLDAVLDSIGTPEATDECLDHPITGKPFIYSDGVLTPVKGNEVIEVGKITIIRWLFNDPLANIDTAYCDQKVTAIGTAAPVFDCNSLDTLPFTAVGECYVELGDQDIPTPVAKDSCTKEDVLAEGVREDGTPVLGKFDVGPTKIIWTFKSPNSITPKVCEQIVWVKTDKEIDAKCGEENYPSQTFVIKDNSCSIPSDSVNIDEHTTNNPCLTDVIITGVPTRSDNLSMTDDFPIGKTIITWTFVDTTNTLVHDTAICEQIIEVKDEKEPKVDCETVFPSAKIFLDYENCSADFAMLPISVDSIPVNPCNNDIARIDTVRASGAGMHDPYEVGKDTITWTFTFEMTNQSFTCTQFIEVIDTLAPDFDCDALPDSVVVALSSGDSVSFQDVKDAGFIIPVVTDKCCEVTTTITRDDNKALEGNYGLGNTVVLFDFADDHDNHKQCTVTVIVKDMIPPVVTCPGLAKTNFDCITDTTVAYATYEEFKQAGGSVDDESKILPETLGHFDIVDGDYCSADITRNYYLLTTRHDTVFCENPQHMHAEDTVAPTYVGILPGGQSVNMGCDSYIDEPLEVTALDSCDSDPKVKMTRTSTQSSDPNDCSYYTFDITYTYVASDRCGNTADPITYTIHVKDTVAPVVHEPSDWKDEMYPTYLKNCQFGVPDITALLPKDSIYQNCGDASTLKIWQTPESGTLITETTVVYLHIEDVCGNDTVMQKVVRVQPRDEIIKVTVATDPYVCGDDASLAHPTSAENSLSNAQIRDYNGVVYYQDYDGSWVPVPTTVFWDYYRGSIAPENIIYSNNELTYADKFKDAQDLYSEEGMKAFGKYNLLLRRNQSDTYYFVASDTITGCSDTAAVYIDVRERPRIDLAGGLWKLCEGDSLDINGEFKSTFPACVDPLGGTIKEEGWLVNDSVYKHGEPVNYDNGSAHTAIYYAINECGSTRSDSSLYVSCQGDLETYEDSLSFAGSKENMKLFQEDRLIIADSVILDVYTHFDPTQVLLSTNPQDKARIWEGDDAQLILTLPYKPSVYKWYRVVNAYDGAGETVYDREGNIVSGGSLEGDDEDLGTLSKEDGNGRYVFTLNAPSDSSSYYVLVGNGVCPTEASNLVSIDVMHQLPTAITPYDRDGLNDDFMKGHYVIIFNRYGQKIVESNDGWDGTYRGLLADPGVYYYTVVMKTGLVHNGAIEVVKIK